jgi:serine/threonine protein kinase
LEIVCIFIWWILKYVDIILDKIGEGGFGSVYLCSNTKQNNNYLYALKCIKSSELINSGERERRFGYVSKLNSRHLVKYHI